VLLRKDCVCCCLNMGMYPVPVGISRVATAVWAVASRCPPSECKQTGEKTSRLPNLTLQAAVCVTTLTPRIPSSCRSKPLTTIDSHAGVHNTQCLFRNTTTLLSLLYDLSL